jgi:hypothetical protein
LLYTYSIAQIQPWQQYSAMKSDQEIKNTLNSVSRVMSKIHKMILENEIGRIEKAQGVVLSPATKVQLLLSDPTLAWLRPMSQLMSSIDGVCFQKEPITADQPKEIYQSIDELFFKPSNSDFIKQYFAQLVAVPDLMIEHGHLKVAFKQLAS